MNELQPYSEGELTIMESPEIGASISQASHILMKQYLSGLHKYEIVPVEDAFLSEDINGDASEFTRFFCIKNITYDKEEDNLLKLSNVYNALSVARGSLVLIIDSNGEKISFYIGVRTFSNDDLPIAQDTLLKTLSGNFPGCVIEPLKNDKINRLVKRIFECKDERVLDTHRAISSVSGISSSKKIDDSSKKKDFTQGIEKLIDSMRGEQYTALIVADPILPEQAIAIRSDYEEMYSLLKPFEEVDLTLGYNESVSVSETVGRSTSKAINHSVSNSTNRTHSSSTSYSKRSFPIFGRKTTYSSSVSESNTNTVTDGTTTTTGENESRTDGTTTGTSKSAQIKTCNRKVKSLLDKIDLQLKRFEINGDIGMWNCSAYFIADDIQTSNAAAMAYYALTKGEESGLEHTAINTWVYNSDLEENEGVNAEYLKFEKYLKLLSHPLFKTDILDGPFVSTSSVLTTKELTVHAGLPQKSVPGLAVSEFASFGRDVFTYADKDKKSETSPAELRLGQISHVGQNEGTEVSLDVASLCSHVFVTGSTGAGKSNAIYTILEKLLETKNKKTKENISFLVIEPAKGEYKRKFGNYDNVTVYGTNYKKSRLLKINPFSFPDDIHVREHIDKLIGIFNACWEMYAAMPAVLKDAVERAYMKAGWNLQTSENKYEELFGKPVFPCFKDILKEIQIVMDSSDYSDDSKGDYKGALITRVKSLTNGIYEDVFTPNELSNVDLFDKNVIVDLSRNSGSETASLIMGILVMKMQEYRMTSSIPSNSGLRHVTVLEEAHNLLKKTSTSQSNEGSNLAGKSVEMISNSIAEMRTYGEGFIIADQAPGLLDPSAIRNTNTKIILRLPDASDRELVGKAAALNDDQIVELAKLKRGVAAVYQNDWIQSVLCQVDKCTDDEEEYRYKPEILEGFDRASLINALIDYASTGKICLDSEKLNLIYRCNIPAYTKVQFAKLENTEEPNLELIADILYDVVDPVDAFDMCSIFDETPEQWTKEFVDNIPALKNLDTETKYLSVEYLVYSRHEKQLMDEETTEKIMDFSHSEAKGVV